ncbi:MAG: MFS transporter [Legionellaceae bacterium]|nr:MFS transporter [Legionellaceae bacterium]|tara:strand:+ start:1207 stop:2421 length:1215 start_codon:yes stop_codon:yes gene_type:complete
MKDKSIIIKAAPLFLAILIDSAGMGLFFPLLNGLILYPKVSLLAASTPEHMRYFLYGLLLSIYMIFWFFGSAILGDFSDGLGRRRALSICLFGSFIGYLLAGIAVIEHSFMLLLLGRIIDGFTAGSQPIAQAAIVDMSLAKNRVRNLGYIMLAGSIGFVIGPMLGGVLSDSHIYHAFNYSTPLYFAAFISLLNAALVFFTLKESLLDGRKIKIRMMYAVELFVDAFRHKAIRQLSIILLWTMIGWSAYFSYISLLLWHRYHYDSIQVAEFWTVLAIGYTIGFAYLVGKCAKFPPKQVTFWGFLITGMGIMWMTVTHSQEIAWISALIIGMANGVGYTTLVGMFSNQVDDARQGWVMGITGSLMAAGIAITTFFAGFLTQLNVNIPFVVSFSAYAICVIWIGLNR